MFSSYLAKFFFAWLVSFQLWAMPLLNNPYPASDASKSVYYSSFAEQPKTLDPARSYSSNEYQFIAQIYEPLLDYDYFTRPWLLVPLTASSMPDIRYLDKNRQPVVSGQKDIAYTVYTLHIKRGIFYQPHPALAKDANNHYLYLNLPPDYLDDHNIAQLSDFAQTGTRELLADDYIYQIKRLASPAVNSPVFGVMSEHIVGFQDFARQLPTQTANKFLDLRRYPLAGVHKLDDYSFEITLDGQYQQFIYWLAMPFFSPVPWEADKFYSQEGMSDKNLTFDWYPVGTGAFFLSENNPNRRIVLDKNPNFRMQRFPENGSMTDSLHGYMKHKGEQLPLIDQAVYTLEKESIPRWNKFLQGYYDVSGISTDSFDQAIQTGPDGKPGLSPVMQSKGMRLVETSDPSLYYFGFNMLDASVGGSSERARKLRQSLSIALNYDENILLFYNGRGQPAQGPIPPGITGFKEGGQGINPYVYQWDGSKAVRKNLSVAKQLLVEAGYPGGHDPATGKALILHYDVASSGNPDDKSLLDWMRKQFAQLGIDLDIRSTDYNRFQEKMRNGNAQLFSWGWNADYPDAENFLFLFYSGNSKVEHGGENASNYKNAEYDQLFEQMRNEVNGPLRQRLIDRMVEILRHDAPVVWGINTQTLILSQSWVSPVKPNAISSNQLKYLALDIEERNRLRYLWNQPVLWPLWLLSILLMIGIIFLLILYKKRDREKARRLPS